MAGGTDGSITIDTKIDTKGFDEGTKKVDSTSKKSLGGVANKVKDANASLVKIGSAISRIGGMLGIAFSVGAITSFVKGAVDAFSWMGSEFTGRLRAVDISFMRLQGVVAVLFDTLLATFGPFIIDAISWLITQLTTLAQIVKAVGIVFFGLGDTSKGIKAAGDQMGRLTNQTDRMGKAAQGALASFDELHVLNAQPIIPGVDVPADMLNQVQTIKDQIDGLFKSIADGTIWAQLWASIQAGAAATWAWLQGLWGQFAVWFKSAVLDPITASPAWQAFSAWAAEAWGKVSQTWGQVAGWFTANVFGPLGEKFGGLVQIIVDSAQRIYDFFVKPLISWLLDNVWPVVQQVAGLIGAVMGGMTDLIVSNFKLSFEFLIALIKDVAVIVAGVIGGIITIIGGIINFVTGVFTSDWRLAWEGIKQIFQGTFDVLYGIFRGVANIIIDLLNGLMAAWANAVNAVIGGLNSIKIDIPTWVPVFGGQAWGVSLPPVTAPQIPRLATGAVIPPNAEFAAILGDQKAGRNIESPEELLRQIVREETQNGGQQITIRFEGSMSELVRLMRPAIERENNRVGSNLIQGVMPV